MQLPVCTTLSFKTYGVENVAKSVIKIGESDADKNGPESNSN